MNLPNLLTIFRLILAGFFVLALSTSWPCSHTVALALFLVATATDYADGVIARKYNLITDFGKLMDPLADKVLTASAFICLITFGYIPAWAVIIIISREFLITGLRLLASSKGIVLPAEKLGKHKTAWQMITIIYFLLLLASIEWSIKIPLLTGPSAQILGDLLIAITVALTVYSGAAYFWKNRQLIAAS